MPVICCVVGCTNHYEKGGNVSFFRFPDKPERRYKWLEAISREKWIPSKCSGVCSEHFHNGRPSRERSDPDFVPSINLGYEKKFNDVYDHTMQTDSCRCRRTQSLRGSRFMKGSSNSLPRGGSVNSSPKDRTSSLPRSSSGSINRSSSGRSCNSKPCASRNSIQSGRSTSRSNLSRKVSFSDQVADGKTETLDVDKLRQEKELRSEIQLLTTKIHDLEEVNEKTKFGEDFLQNDDQRTKFLTGIPTYAAFCWMVSVSTPILPKSRNLTPADTLIMLLSQLKLNLLTQDVAYRYNIAVSRVRQIADLSLPLLAKKLQFFGRKEIISTLPENFKQGIYRVVLLLTLKDLM